MNATMTFTTQFSSKSRTLTFTARKLGVSLVAAAAAATTLLLLLLATTTEHVVQAFVVPQQPPQYEAAGVVVSPARARARTPSPTTTSSSVTFVTAIESTTTPHNTQQEETQASASAAADTNKTKAPPRKGLAQTLLNFALQTPLWKHVLVPQARNNIVQTAEANGIPWKASKAWLASQLLELENKKHDDNDDDDDDTIIDIPDYYRQPFHAYEQGNLCWDAALEVELASCSVGARNFPQFGAQGEQAFRSAFDSALLAAGARVGGGIAKKYKNNKKEQKIITIVDLGCGTGMSTRRLAQNWHSPKVTTTTHIIGMDLSKYFIHVGNVLLHKLAPVNSFYNADSPGPWVSDIDKVNNDNDNNNNNCKISYKVANAADTGLPDNSVDVVNLQFVLHELPPTVAADIVHEAYRILKPETGQLWICEMDFESPAYAAQRANALLFALIRSTEPYLDDYAESITGLFQDVIRPKFAHTHVVPATGRHFALVATKGSNAASNDKDADSKNTFIDDRFDEQGNYRIEDTHLKVWESKQEAR